MESAKKVLAIDDEIAISESIEVYLESKGYKVNTAKDGKEGLEKFFSDRPDIVLIDLHMPYMNGFDVMAKMIEKGPNIPIIMISGTGVLQDAIEAIRRGAWDFLSKPIEDMALLDHVLKKSLERASLIKENETYRKNLEQKVTERTVTIDGMNKKLIATLDDIVVALSIITDKRDPYTSGHQKRVALLAVAIAERMGFSSDKLNEIRIAGLLHDIGKIYVPAEFLSKPSRLEPEEMAVIRKHPAIGYDIIKNIKFPWPVADIVLQHHERLDGSGYPYGLTDNDICIEAKIISIADVVEAMASHRPYRPSLGIDKALREIKQNIGSVYCTYCAQVLMELFEKDRKKLMSIFI